MARKTAKTAKSSNGRTPGRKAQNGKRKRAQPPQRSWTGRIFRGLIVLAIWSAVILAGVVAYYAYDLPDVGKIAETTRRPSVRLLATDGSQIAAFGDLYGETVSVSGLPPHLPRAILAVEDRRFYEHPGLDVMGLLRAIAVNIREGRVVQGGSTISQQLAKVLFLKPDRTVKRKVQELMLALWLEHRFTKDQILTLYMNRVYLGAGAYGVDAAARRYFGKPAARVSLYEAALLAGLLRAPSRYNPANNADLADRRAKVVLDAMEVAGFVTAGEAARAYTEKSRGKPSIGRHARHFADWVMTQVASFVGRPDSDLVVVTTLQSGLQRIAESESEKLLDGLGQERDASQAAFVAMTQDGAVRAMVGGRDYADSQFNRAVQALRQPGSAFKTFVFLSAFERGYNPDDRVVDEPVRFGKWAPENYKGRYYGEVTLREAFTRSLNSVAARLTMQLGPETVADTARRLGITSELKATGALGLGASEVSLLELTGAYGAFANRGNAVWPYGIEEIRESGGRILYRREGGGPGRVVVPRTVNAMTDVLRANVEWGSGKRAKPGRPAGGKTGTSQDFRDAWFVGFTAELIAGAWVGNDDGTPMKEVTGGTLPSILWGNILRQGLEGEPVRPLPGAPAPVAVARSEPAEPLPAPVRTDPPSDEELGLIARILRTLALEDDEAAREEERRREEYGSGTVGRGSDR